MTSGSERLRGSEAPRRKPSDTSLADLLAEALLVYEEGRALEDGVATNVCRIRQEPSAVDLSMLADTFRGQCVDGVVKMAGNFMRSANETQTAKAFALIGDLVVRGGKAQDEFFVMEDTLEESRIDGGKLSIVVAVPRADAGGSSVLQMTNFQGEDWFPVASVVYEPNQLAGVEVQEQHRIPGRSELWWGPRKITATVGQLALAYYYAAEMVNSSSDHEIEAPQIALSDFQRHHILDSLHLPTSDGHTPQAGRTHAEPPAV